jgi:hypothetical protein
MYDYKVLTNQTMRLIRSISDKYYAVERNRSPQMLERYRNILNKLIARYERQFDKLHDNGKALR